MPESRAVTDEDLLVAWEQLYYRNPEWSDIPVVPPDPADRFDQITLAALRRVLEHDRKRVALEQRADGSGGAS